MKNIDRKKEIDLDEVLKILEKYTLPKETIAAPIQFLWVSPPSVVEYSFSVNDPSQFDNNNDGFWKRFKEVIKGSELLKKNWIEIRSDILSISKDFIDVKLKKLDYVEIKAYSIQDYNIDKLKARLENLRKIKPIFSKYKLEIVDPEST